MSNFWLWQGSYSEFYFTDKFWPDFGKPDLEMAIADYYRRERDVMAKPDNFLSSIPDLPFKSFQQHLHRTFNSGRHTERRAYLECNCLVVAMISLWEFYKLLSTKHDISPWLIMVSGAFILIGASSEMSLTAILCSISSIVFVALFLRSYAAR